jgi:purine-binding chemotaxis protein CheW
MSARLPDPRRAPPTGGPLLAFLADGREYALPIAGLLEVIRYRHPTPIPGAGVAIEGILPHRGRMITLVDVRRCLGLSPRPGGAAARVIVAAVEGEWHGLVVDAVVRVVGAHDQVLHAETLVGAAV